MSHEFRLSLRVGNAELIEGFLRIGRIGENDDGLGEVGARALAA